LIKKWGTPKDKASLPAPTARNKAHKSKRTFVIHGDARVDERISVNKVSRKTVIRWAVGEQVAAAFEDAFCGVSNLFLLGLFPGHETGQRKGGRGPVRNNINVIFWTDFFRCIT
jgi:hypothetical protein